MNRTTLCGHVGAIKQLHIFENGNSVLRFTLATNDYWKDNNGNNKQKTEWHTIVAYGAFALALNDKLKVGDKIEIEGPLTYDKYVNKDGITVPTSEVKVLRYLFIEKKETNHA